MATSSERSAWALDPAEVSEAATSLNVSGRRRAGDSRALDTTRAEIRLTHRPSGIEVRGVIPSGHRSRKTMRRLRAELRARLWSELELAVARHLRIPGRVR